MTAALPRPLAYELQQPRGLSASQRQVVLSEHSLAAPRETPALAARTPMQSIGSRSARVARASYQASRWQEDTDGSGAEPVPLGRNPMFELRTLAPDGRGAAAAAGGSR